MAFLTLYSEVKSRSDAFNRFVIIEFQLATTPPGSAVVTGCQFLFDSIANSGDWDHLK
jgi:hypothetical protein